ncbi:MAG: hypothetical protein GY896_22815 [Gammaproteobacteria bacterium]|nr:hypothetical protein [Gammaproteobacteria bacterium]
MDHPATGDAKRFLDLWFGEGADQPPKGYILIWVNPGKRSEWFNDIEKAANYAIGETTRNVYFGTSLSERDHGANRRLDSKKRPAKGILGFHNDFDILGEGHKKKSYPPDLDSVNALVKDIPISPTIMVATGGGVHCYWAFHEAWIFKDDKDREAAQALARKWHKLVLTAAEARGWTMDNVSDLERVMRVPGTWNNKDPRNPAPVEISFEGTWRYSPDDFNMFLKEVDTPSVQVPEVPKEQQDKQLSMSIDADPPILKFEALIGNLRAAKDTWEHKRKDLQDQSGSSYDMAMANYCVAAGFTIQETVNTLIAMRRKHNDPNLQRKLREGYFKGTFDKAWQTFSTDATLSRQRSEAHQRFSGSDDDERRKTAIEDFNKMVGFEKVPITEVVCFIAGEEAEYHIKTKKGTVVMSSKEVYSFSKFSEKYFGAFQDILPHMTLKQWKYQALKILINQATREEIIEEVRDEGSNRSSMLGWVEAYLAKKRIHPELTIETYKGNHPFKDSKGNFYVHNDAVRKWIGRHRDNKIPVGKMPSLLRSAGLEPDKKKIAGFSKQARYWKYTPSNVIEFPLEKTEEESS